MVIVLETTLVTSAQILLYQAKKMDTLVSIAGVRAYSDDTLQEIMNTVIQFIHGNSPASTDEDILKFAIKDLCKIELNNRLHEDKKLPEWVSQDAFDKEYLTEMLSGIIEGEDPTARLWVYNNTTEY